MISYERNTNLSKLSKRKELLYHEYNERDFRPFFPFLSWKSCLNEFYIFLCSALCIYLYSKVIR